MIHRYAPESHQYINLLMKYYRLISLLFFFDKEIPLQGYIVKSFVVVEMQVYCCLLYTSDAADEL